MVKTWYHNYLTMSKINYTAMTHISEFFLFFLNKRLKYSFDKHYEDLSSVMQIHLIYLVNFVRQYGFCNNISQSWVLLLVIFLTVNLGLDKNLEGRMTRFIQKVTEFRRSSSCSSPVSIKLYLCQNHNAFGLSVSFF